MATISSVAKADAKFQRPSESGFSDVRNVREIGSGKLHALHEHRQGQEQ